MKTSHPPVKIILEISSCSECPKSYILRTPHAGDAMDYYCEITGHKTSGYVEAAKDIRPVPNDCPLLAISLGD